MVIDSFSTDQTVEISEQLGAKVGQVKFEGFGKLRMAGIEHTSMIGYSQLILMKGARLKLRKKFSQR